MKTNQVARLREQLELGRSITRLSALNELGIFELSSRIIALEKEGFRIKKQRIKVTNRFGESIHIVKYSKDDN